MKIVHNGTHAGRVMKIFDVNRAFFGVERRKICTQCKTSHYLNFARCQEPEPFVMYYPGQFRDAELLRVSETTYLTRAFLDEIPLKIYHYRSSFKGIAQFWNDVYGAPQPRMDTKGRDVEMGFKLFSVGIRLINERYDALSSLLSVTLLAPLFAFCY